MKKINLVALVLKGSLCASKRNMLLFLLSVLFVSCKSGLTGKDRTAISSVINKMSNTLGTNIIQIERLNYKTIRVYTQSTEGGHGGDMILMEKNEGNWKVLKNGLWME
jgi:hypothetical protein